MNTQTRYRDRHGVPVMAAHVRSDPDASAKRYSFAAVRSDPTESNVIGTVDGVPVILATDLGEYIHSRLMREVAFKLPGDKRLYRTALDADCDVPRHRSWSARMPVDSPFRKTGYYLVLHVSDLTWSYLDDVAGR